MKVKIASTEQEIQKCFPIMVQLRPRLALADFLERVRHQSAHYGYRLAYLEDTSVVKSVAGFVIREMLSLGRFLYIDDFVTDSSERSKGYGAYLFNWLAGYAKEQECQHLHLDSRLDRPDAHRFYLRQGMRISGHHFALDFALDLRNETMLRAGAL